MDIRDLHALSHMIILTVQYHPAQQPGDTPRQGERCLTRHRIR
jgi:hypothetical protein